MKTPGLDQIAGVLRRVPLVRRVARIIALDPDRVTVSLADLDLALGDQVEFLGQPGRLTGEVVTLSEDRAVVVVEGATSALGLGGPVVRLGPYELAPHDSWIGRVIDPWGRPLDDRPLFQGNSWRAVDADPPPSAARRGFGVRQVTGLHVLNTLIPLVRGQRIGLFAGAGVGKSSLIGTLASDLDADVVVVGLVGERGREVGAFVRQVLGSKGMERSVVIAATSDSPALTRRRAAFAAMTVAEHFRDEGKNVLLLIDSVTRLADAHREIASASGEPSTLRGFPPSVQPLLAGLSERAGPGFGGQGDITAVFSVLVAGGDMDEPIADTLRGLLDGHIILSRDIAEGGRFPAIDLARSVSRSLPEAASPDENAIIAEVRRLVLLYEKSEVMIRSGLYQAGANPELDRAVAIYDKIDAFIGQRTKSSISESFAVLASILNEPMETAAPAFEEETVQQRPAPRARAER